ncbi:DUF2785 domain-containing protein [Streptomyces sp. NPDC001380]|uniref:DUF2785 domain-containing protein n=1 Tax=Streptomyces sp. NPDC001380 TaxID=3364566 RepID=UPI0036CC56F8
MSLWQEITNDGSLPAERSHTDLVAELSVALRSPDPEVRDEHAYTLVARWTPLLEPKAARLLGDEMAARFADPEIQARTFAPLVLAKVVRCGHYDPHWLTAFTHWYPTETDLRGWDPVLGWLHAVAHGADLLAAFGSHPEVDPVPLLALATDRLLAPTDHVFDAQEDDRVAFALAQIISRPELTERQAVAWLGCVQRSGVTGSSP